MQEIKSRIEHKVSKPDKEISFQKVADNRILEGKVIENGFIIVMGRYGLTYGKTSLLPYLIGKFKPTLKTKTKLTIIIQPSTGSGLIILGLVYIVAIVAILISWSKSNYEGILIPAILIVVTYISMLLKFNKEKKIYLDFIEQDILRK